MKRGNGDIPCLLHGQSGGGRLRRKVEEEGGRGRWRRKEVESKQYIGASILRGSMMIVAHTLHGRSLLVPAYHGLLAYRRGGSASA